MCATSDSRMLILGAGYIGAAVARRAKSCGWSVTMADNWHATEPRQVEAIRASGVHLRTVDIRHQRDLDALFSADWTCVMFLAAQSSRHYATRDPEYTEQTNLVGVRLVAETAVRAACRHVIFGSSIHVYGNGMRGRIGPRTPYGAQTDLAHLSKVYAELCLDMITRDSGTALTILRVGIVYGPSPVEHEDRAYETVVNRFVRQADSGEELVCDRGGLDTIAVVHLEDVARIFVEVAVAASPRLENVAAETLTVAELASQAVRQTASHEERRPAFFVDSPFRYEYDVRTFIRDAVDSPPPLARAR